VKRFLSLKSRDVIVVVAVAMFMAQLDGAVLAVAVPRISRDFGVPVVSLSLAITIYLTKLVAMLPISGWAADRFGARGVFLGATLGFGCSSLLCALAQSYWPFIAARALQGIAAALLTPVGRLILVRETPKEELVDALAISAMPMLVAPTVGPSVGGFIVD
jgi:MFS family permease